MGWTMTAMLDPYTSWIENESEEALEAFRGAKAVKNYEDERVEFSEGE